MTLTFLISLHLPMTTTAANHPIHRWIIQARQGGPPYLSNLENLVKQYPKYLEPGMECIEVYIRPPWWKLDAIITIPRVKKDEAANIHQQRLHHIPAQDLIIYTDGSGQKGQIGAAIFSPTINTIKTEYIGTEDTHNVYAAELTAIQMAITLFEQKIAEYRNVFIFTDNQSSIKAIEHPRHQSGQYIIKQILDSINRIHDLEPTCIIHLEWVPGHMNIEGNEQADKAAKTAAAASNNTSITTRLRAAQYTSIQTMTNAKWKNEWTTGRETARRLRSISKQPDTTTGPKLYNALQQRKHVTWISRLRTGHCHLNEYLYRFNIIETPMCECGAEKETVDHYLLNCELYDEERDALRRKVGIQGMKISTLLGDNKIIKETIEYIEKTGRFKLDRG